MNGFGLLIYVLAVGQVANSGRPFAYQYPSLPATPSSAASGPAGQANRLGALPASTNSAETNVYQYGWDIDTDGSLYYIMQIAPDEAQQMNVEGTEKWSDMPKELIGRIARISVRVGTARLPRNPTLQEISRRPLLNAGDVTAALNDVIGPSDRLATVDAAPPVVNVQGRGESLLAQLSNPNRAPPPDYSGRARDVQPPALPTAPPPYTGNTSPPFAGTGGTGSAGTGNLGAAFLNATSGNQLSAAPASASDPLSKFQDAPDPNTPNGPVTGSAGNWAAANDRYTLPGGLAADGRNNQAAGGVAPVYGRPNPQTGIYPDVGSQQTPAPGFGSPSGSIPSSITERFNAQMQPGYDAYSQPGYAGAGQSPGTNGQGNLGQGNYGQGSTSDQAWARLEQERRDQLASYAAETARLAMNTGPAKVFPTTEQASGRETDSTSSNDRIAGGTQAGSGTQAGNSDSRTQSADGIVRVFFLLSLVVNFYLGTLIRKLLTRYRTLLSNVRGQTA